MSKTTDAPANTDASTLDDLPMPYGTGLTKPMTTFAGVQFSALSQDDVDYFHLVIEKAVLTTMMSLQNWVFDHRPSYRRLIFDLARKNTIVAWALTALAQTDRVNRRCCFLHMALAYQDTAGEGAAPA